MVLTFSDRPVHFPSGSAFEFDDEVASIFDNMAPRSIPLYRDVHALHLAMFRDRLVSGFKVLDVGASTGRLFEVLEKVYGTPLDATDVEAHAYDTSEAMLDILRLRYPSVNRHLDDVSRLPLLDSLNVDMAFCMYTLQFIPHSRKVRALEWIAHHIKPGGVLILGQKDELPQGELADRAAEQYYAFRRANNYTQSEIDAKTAALKNSMWPLSVDQLKAILDFYRFDYVETTRWMQFSTFACIKRG